MEEMLLLCHGYLQAESERSPESECCEAYGRMYEKGAAHLCYLFRMEQINKTPVLSLDTMLGALAAITLSFLSVKVISIIPSTILIQVILIVPAFVKCWHDFWEDFERQISPNRGPLNLPNVVDLEDLYFKH